MKSEDFTTIKQEFSLENINSDITEVISQQIHATHLSNFDISHGIFSIISSIDPELTSFFSNINYLLNLYLENSIFDMKWENCIYCNSENITTHDFYNKSMKDLVGMISIKIQRYMCKDCNATFSLDDGPLNLAECQISLPLSRLMVTLYTGGLSLRFTADIINSTYGLNIHHDTVREHILKWGHRIREKYQKDLSRKKVGTMQMDEQYVSIRCQDPRDSSVQSIVKLDSDNNRIIDIEVNNARQITDLDTRIALEKLDQPPETLLTDGAKGIAAAMIDYPETEHRLCLGHGVRNIRKRKYYRDTISELSSEIIDSEKKKDEDKWHKYKRGVIEDLTELVKQKKIIKKTGKIEIEEVNKMRDRDMESKYGEEVIKVREKIHKAIMHRRFYCGFEAAERMKHCISKNITIEQSLQLELTTGKLEGYNRLMRNRERKALCFRSIETVGALSHLFSEFYNHRRGHGIVETPFIGFHQIDTKRIGTQHHPITIRSERYKQQFSRNITELLHCEHDQLAITS